MLLASVLGREMCRAVGCAGVRKVCPCGKAMLLRLASEHKFAYLWDEVLVGLFPLASCQAGLAESYKLP